MFALVVTLVLTQHAPSLADGRVHVRALREGNVDAKFAGLSRAINSYGMESKLVSEALEPGANGFTYTRTSAVTNWARGITVTLSLSPTGALQSGVVGAARAEAPTIYGAYETRTKFSMRVRCAVRTVEAPDVSVRSSDWIDNARRSMSCCPMASSAAFGMESNLSGI